jgi:hypothetical protein
MIGTINMSAKRLALIYFFNLALAGCGTYVPGIQEIPGDSVAGQQLVTAIVNNVKCEVQDAIDDLYRLNSRPFLDGWGVQIALNLTMVEKGALNPAGVYAPVSPISTVFTLGVGGELSSEATRTEKLSSYYTVSELRRLGRCRSRANGPFLLQGDLKLNEWLMDVQTAGNTGGTNLDTGRVVFKDGVLSHEVKFDIVTSGNITPSWTFLTGSINPAGTTFLSARRERSHDLTITFGQTQDIPGARGKRGPTRAAADAALASDIGLSVANSLRRLRP